MIDPLVMAAQASAADYLRLFRMSVGTQTVSWDATAAQTPSSRTIKFDLPKVGLASRILVDVEAVFTAVEAAGAGVPAKPNFAPYSACSRLAVTIGGSGSLIDVSGVGAHILADIDGGISTEAFKAQPWPTPAANYDVQHQVYSWDEATVPPKVTGTARWGYALPFSLYYGQPLGMVLLGTDKTLATLTMTMADINAWVQGAANANPAATKVTATIRVVYEYFEVPSESAYGQFVAPLLRYAHRITEDRQDIVSKGPGANVVQLLPYDSILQIAQYFVINGAFDATSIDEARLKLNRTTTRDQFVRPAFWKEQREQLGLDIPALVWHYYERGSLRSAIRADEYTDIRTEIDINSGATLAAGDYVSTITRKLVDLGASNG